MPQNTISRAAYPRLSQHPLASAIFAIVWATLLVIGVAGVSVLKSDEAHAADGSARAQHAGLGGEPPADAP